MKGLQRLSRQIREAATARSIDHVRVVGSVAKGTARSDSDVDLLVKVSARLRGAEYFAALDEFREKCTRITRRPVDVIDEAGVPEGATKRRLVHEARSL